ncbi:MAG: hypothetical protein IJE80_02325 [Peptococcaceae bacterium]|nr:hypothetical protein [Peptococcaceae bacterium]MBO5428614.1 hypothetical protein [Peptococcaceae bacterium]MBP3341444.1 hypothetical protein [Peptococcaceae bacterium]MBP3625970.1 hypothetical protein [Peptococcaceae bacterium]MBQ2836846.1 hypothetical protein [Peptococcaceae bacterium]
MELGKLCEDLFCQNGQIGYYLLHCRLTREEEECQGGAVSAFECHHSAQPGL